MKTFPPDFEKLAKIQKIGGGVGRGLHWVAVAGRPWLGGWVAGAGWPWLGGCGRVAVAGCLRLAG